MFPRKFSAGSIGQVSGKTGSPEHSGITTMAAKCHVIPKQRQVEEERRIVQVLPGAE